MSRMNRRRALGWLGLGACGPWAVAASPPQRIPESVEGEADDANGGRGMSIGQGMGTVWSVALNGPGDLLATGTQGEIIFWDFDCLKIVRRCGPPVGKGAAFLGAAFLAFSPDGKRIASGEMGGAV